MKTNFAAIYASLSFSFAPINVSMQFLQSPDLQANTPWKLKQKIGKMRVGACRGSPNANLVLKTMWPTCLSHFLQEELRDRSTAPATDLTQNRYQTKYWHRLFRQKARDPVREIFPRWKWNLRFLNDGNHVDHHIQHTAEQK